MIIVLVVIFWFGALCGMEQEVPVGKERSPVLSLEEIAVRKVCGYLVDKKISVDRVRQKLPSDILKRIESNYEPRVLLPTHKDVHYYLDTITPNHRYMLVSSKQGLLRLDLCTNETIVVDDSKENIWIKALSPSGNLVVLILPENKLLVKDIARDEIVAEQDRTTYQVIIGQFIRYRPYMHMDPPPSIHFSGEKELLFCFNTIHCLTIDKKLEGNEFEYVVGRYVGVLPTLQEYIRYTNGAFLRTTSEGKIKNLTTVQGSDFDVRRNIAIYEPDMLIAYQNAANDIDIVSLKEGPEVVEPLKRLQFGEAIDALAFANKGQWLMVGKGKISVWNWKNNQRLYIHWMKNIIGYISSTDRPTPYPCLFEGYLGSAVYSFNPIKAVVAAMLFPSKESAEISNHFERLNDLQNQYNAATSNNNNNSNNNDNNVSNDNGPQPTISIETTTQGTPSRKPKKQRKATP